MMGKFFFAILWGLWGILPVDRAMGQGTDVLFQPYTWEQASLLAARENKLVLVAVGPVGARTEKSVFNNSGLTDYIRRYVIAIRVDLDKVPDFQHRLWMYKPPVFAFFMPYGDLLEAVTPEIIAENPEVLREMLEKARERATVKRNNSRTVRFDVLSLEEALAQAGKTEKLVFVYLSAEQHQPCLLLEKNVLNLNEVADFYNSNFVNLSINTTQNKEQSNDWGINELPGIVFLNGQGKIVHKQQGVITKAQVLEGASVALKKAQGISFQELPDEKARQLAASENKLIFTDYYIPGGVHKEMLRRVYTDPDVADLFNRQFINVARESKEAFWVFADREGKELHRVIQVMDPDDLLREAQLAAAGKGIAGMQKEYEQGNREADFLERYMKMLGKAGKAREAAQIAATYFSALPADCLKEAKYWDIFNDYVLNSNSDHFNYVLTHREELYLLYGKENVRKKIAAIWIAGAEDFVKNGVFDEAGFKAYTKRLKKEKVEEWRLIVRNARMNVAEKTGDWKTYVELAEEKWYEEKISDAELYSWGVKINEHCHDEAIRYKAAHWFVQAAREIEQKERTTGKISMGSYKSFFVKLADDLVGKK